MIRSMTAFASRRGALGATGWAWEMRGVNARGLDLRLRLPDGIDGLEPAIRAALQDRFNRGNITLGLRLTREEGQQAATLDEAQLDRMLQALDAVQDRAMAMGVTLAQPTAADVLNLRGVLSQRSDEAEAEALKPALLADLAPLLDDFAAMRASEGAALKQVIEGQLQRIAALVEEAATAAESRRDEVRANMGAALRRVMEEASEADPDRVAQELALIAVKSDVTEEVDRLRAHIAAARALLADPAPAGRKLDFLAQEFNREANTLCSKSGAPGLTAIGLDLKATIDQMREQIQNVE